MPSSPISPALSLAVPVVPTQSSSHGRLPPSHPPGSADWWNWSTPTKASAQKGEPVREAAGAYSRSEVKMIGEWRVGESVGKGSSGRVRIARHTRSGEYGCVKMIRKPAADSKHPTSVDREIIVMKICEHDSILRLIDVFETPSHVYLITDYCPHGELYHYIISQRISPEMVLRFFSQLISAVSHLHSLTISHRDIKFENLLLVEDEETGDLNIKLADLGMAAFQPDGCLMETSCGSPHYASPQVVFGEQYDGAGADIWSCGVVLYALVTRRLPFDDDHVPTLLQKIVVGAYRTPSSLTGDAKDLVSRMLLVNPNQRITLDEIREHPFLGDAPVTLEFSLPYPLLVGVGYELPRAREEIDQEVLENLRVVLRADSMEDVIQAVLADGEATKAQLFYTILVNFRNRTHSSKGIKLADAGTLEATRRLPPSLVLRTTTPTTTPRRSLSLPSLPSLPSLSSPEAPPPDLPAVDQGHQRTYVDEESPLRHHVRALVPLSPPSPSPLPAHTTPHTEPAPTLPLLIFNSNSPSQPRLKSCDNLAPFVATSNLYDGADDTFSPLVSDNVSDNLSAPYSPLDPTEATDTKIGSPRTKFSKFKAIFGPKTSPSQPPADDVVPPSPMSPGWPNAKILKRSTVYSFGRALFGMGQALDVVNAVDGGTRVPLSPLSNVFQKQPKRKRSWLGVRERSSMVGGKGDGDGGPGNDGGRDENASPTPTRLPSVAEKPFHNPVNSLKRRPSPLNLVASNTAHLAFTSQSPASFTANPRTGSTILSPYSHPYHSPAITATPLTSPLPTHDADLLYLEATSHHLPPSSANSYPLLATIAALKAENALLRQKLERQAGELVRRDDRIAELCADESCEVEKTELEKRIASEEETGRCWEGMMEEMEERMEEGRVGV